MGKKHIIAAVVATLAILVAYSIFTRRAPRGLPADSIIGSDYTISASDIQRAFGRIQFSDDSAREYFSRGVLNPLTFRFFKFLQRRFRDMGFDDHLRAVREYLRTIMDEAKAEEMYRLYVKFSQYEKSLADQAKRWGTPSTPAGALDYLRRLQDYRRAYFGKEVADELFGALVKHQEYRIRKSAIIGDASLYGADKEKQINGLRRDMWGENEGEIDSNMRPYDRYQEKLGAYSRDLQEMSDADRQTAIRDYRQQFFTPDVVRRLEAVDTQLAGEQQAETQYRAQEQKILSDVNLDHDEKERKIRELQDSTFGDDAEAFRRREAIEKGMTRKQAR